MIIVYTKTHEKKYLTKIDYINELIRDTTG